MHPYNLSACYCIEITYKLLLGIKGLKSESTASLETVQIGYSHHTISP